MAPYTFLASAALLGLAAAQTPGEVADVHPKVTTWKCSTEGGCVEQTNSLVMDSAAHPITNLAQPGKSCGDWGSKADPTACPDKETCAKNCVMQGITDYSQHGIVTSADNIELKMFNPRGSLSSPRVYLLAEGEKEYEMLQLNGKEFSFDVDVSQLPCGMNGALYLSEMEADGGRSDLNPGGATWGTGYCDAQCFVTPWVNGEGNIEGNGVCCNEMDIWEANARSTSIAPHTCGKDSLFLCTGKECDQGGIGLCDKWGCSDNPYKHRGVKDYYGPGLTIDTTKPFTVITQFPKDSAGVMQAIVRKYVQDGVVYEQANANLTNDQAFCDSFGGATEAYTALGGHKGMGAALERGMVLALSVWWSDGDFMQWLDGGDSGPCNATEGDPKVIQTIVENPVVNFSKIKWGDIGSTFKGNSTRMVRFRA